MTVGGALAGAVAAVVLAGLGTGAWAIIGQQLATAVVTSVLMWRASLLAARADRSRARACATSVASARYLVGHRLLFYVHQNADRFLIGRFIGTAALGAYAVAYNVMLAPAARIGGPLQRVLAPAFSRMQDEPERIAAAWARVTRMLGAIVHPGARRARGRGARTSCRSCSATSGRPPSPSSRSSRGSGPCRRSRASTSTSSMARDRTSTIFRYSIVFTTAHIIAFMIGLHWGIIGSRGRLRHLEHAGGAGPDRPDGAGCIGVSPWVFVRSVTGVAQAAVVHGGRRVAGADGAGRRRRAPGARLVLCIVVGAIVFVPLCAWRVPEVRGEVRGALARFLPKPVADPDSRRIMNARQRHPTSRVVVATHNRAERLAATLAGLRAQTLGPDRFEVIIVDDASSDETPAVLAAALEAGELRLRSVRQEQGGGPARGAQPRLADGRGADDRLHRRRLRAHARLAGGDARDGRQPPRRRRPGPDAAGPARDRRARHVREDRCTSPAPRRTSRPATSLYPRALLEQVAGFDETYPAPAGEDSDLGWRVKGAGGVALFAPDAVVHHAVFPRTPRGGAQGRADGDARRPGLQAQPGPARAPDPGRVLRALAPADAAGRVRALALPPQPGGRGVRRAVRDQRPRPRRAARSPAVKAAAFLVAYDAVQIAATVRGAVRHRTFIL